MHAQLTLPWWPARRAAGARPARSRGPHLVEVELCAGQVFRLQPPLAMELQVLAGELWLTSESVPADTVAGHRSSGGLWRRLMGWHRSGDQLQASSASDLAARDERDLWLAAGQGTTLAAGQGQWLQAWSPVRLRLRPQGD